jgi:8-oxo-dGTP pyrophosphatase MutT (NUDIX family)
MAKITEIFNNKWLSVKKKTMDNGGEYVYAHAPWCGGEGVSILPFRNVETEGGFFHPEFLGRFEICPAHSNDIELCSITGGMDKEGESPAFTARRELIEEAGYEAPVENFVYLGTVRPSKSSDNTTHLFGINLDKPAVKEVEATGDGTLGEEGAYCDWVSVERLADAKDPLLHTMFTRLVQKREL